MMEGQYIRGTGKRVGAYSGGGNAEDGSGDIVGQIVGFLNSAGPYGAAIAGAFNTVMNLFGGGPSEWDGAPPGVHDWFTAYGEEEFKNWARDHHPEAFGSVDAAKALRMLWMFQGAPARNGSFLISTKGAIWGLDKPQYMLSSVQKASEFWATIGVDLPRSIQNRYDNNGTLEWIPPGQIITIPGFIQGIDQEIEETIDAIGNGDALTDEQVDIAEGLLEESDSEEKRSMIITALSAAAALATLAR